MKDQEGRKEVDEDVASQADCDAGRVLDR